MINAILIDNKKQDRLFLENKIVANCSQINICARVEYLEQALQFIRSAVPDLIFIDIDVPNRRIIDILKALPPYDIESIIVTELKDYAIEAMKYCVSGYILKPVQEQDLSIAVENAKKRIRSKSEIQQSTQLVQKVIRELPFNDLIGIPTLEGLTFIQVDNIIRCEGMQRCTRIITTTKTNIVSSYNLGKFRQLLEPYRFFSPHKSHLINLCHIVHYRREGIITMSDNKTVPVSRKRKNDFLSVITHL